MILFDCDGVLSIGMYTKVGVSMLGRRGGQYHPLGSITGYATYAVFSIGLMGYNRIAIW